MYHYFSQHAIIQDMLPSQQLCLSSVCAFSLATFGSPCSVAAKRHLRRHPAAGYDLSSNLKNAVTLLLEILIYIQANFAVLTLITRLICVFTLCECSKSSTVYFCWECLLTSFTASYFSFLVRLCDNVCGGFYPF